jgi:hypothetical protein
MPERFRGGCPFGAPQLAARGLSRTVLSAHPSLPGHGSHAAQDRRSGYRAGPGQRAAGLRRPVAEPPAESPLPVASRASPPSQHASGVVGAWLLLQEQRGAHHIAASRVGRAAGGPVETQGAAVTREARRLPHSAESADLTADPAASQRPAGRRAGYGRRSVTETWLSVRPDPPFPLSGYLARKYTMPGTPIMERCRPGGSVATGAPVLRARRRGSAAVRRLPRASRSCAPGGGRTRSRSAAAGG